jgi:nuclear GTP-binding protein
VLKGVVRVENLEDATEHVGAVLDRVKPEHLTRAYRIQSWSGPEDFLTQLAVSTGKLLRGGEPDVNTAARMVLYDWQRGKVPYFTLPPDYTPNPEQQQEEPAQPSQAVTAEDAAAELEAQPEVAAAAAAALLEQATAAQAQQQADDLPVAQHFDDQDEAGPSDVESEQSEPSDGDGAHLEDSGQANGGEGSDADSDGYDAADLSWEAVMAAVQGADSGASDDGGADTDAPPATAAAQQQSGTNRTAPQDKKRKR